MAGQEEEQTLLGAEAVVVMTTFKAGVDVTARRRNLRSAMRHLGKASGAAENPHAALPVKCLFCTAECLITQLGPPRLGDHPLLQ